jgi:hypothetical protein
MRRAARPIGSGLRRWAERYCTPDVLDALVLPVVADLQFEHSRSTHEWERGLIQLRAYVSLAKGVALHCVLTRRGPVQHSIVTALRLGLMIPLALAASLAAQYVFFQGSAAALFRAAGFADWITWAAKCCSAPFMAAAFLATTWLVAPARFRRAAGIGAFLVVVLWSALMMTGAFLGSGGFNAWLFALGPSGLAGGLAVFLVTRARTPKPA